MTAGENVERGTRTLSAGTLHNEAPPGTFWKCFQRAMNDGFFSPIQSIVYERLGQLLKYTRNHFTPRLGEEGVHALQRVLSACGPVQRPLATCS